MTTTLLTGIGELVTCDPAAGDGSPLGIVRDAALVIDSDGTVAWVGSASAAPAADERVDVDGRAVVPGFVDSHTHLVFAGDRSAEFSARMAGEPYTGGGIATTVAATRAASDEELRASTARLFAEAVSLGTTTVEIKSGYGLDVETEARILRIAGEFTAETTFLGAHVVPPEYADDRAAYVDLVCGPMLSACAPLARWIDVFCDRGAFDEAETRRVLSAGIAAGLMPRLHGNQLGHGPGARVAAEFGAASIDHCTHLTDDDIDAIVSAGVVATLLPGAEFSAGSEFPDARRLIDAGRDGRHRHRLQPGHVVHHVDAADDRAGRPRDAHDARSGASCRNPRRGGCTAQRLDRPDRRGDSGRHRGTRGPHVPPSGLSPRRAARRRGLARRPARDRTRRALNALASGTARNRSSSPSGSAAGPDSGTTLT